MDEPVAENIAEGILSIVRGQKPDEPVLPAQQLVWSALIEKGPEYVKQNFEDLTRNFHPTDPKDIILNSIGYDLIFEGNLEDAISVFELNVELFPEAANCYDSLGEALLKIGDKSKALKKYKKALELDPELPSAKIMVKEIEG
jgi:tetratricopeptide (TPR) repeat protein